MSVAPAGGATAQTAPDDLVAYFNRPAGAEWDDNPHLFHQMSMMNGNPGITLRSCPVPGIAGQLAQGFSSFPQGWVGGMLQVSMAAGLWGETQRIHAEIRNRQLAAILYAAKEDLGMTIRLIRWMFVNILPKDWAFVSGRFAGGAYTAWSTGLLNLKGGIKLAGGFSNFALASYGSAILAIAKNDRRLVSILNAITTGRYDGTICIPDENLQKELKDFNDKLGDDIAPMVKTLEDVLKLSQQMAGM